MAHSLPNEIVGRQAVLSIVCFPLFMNELTPKKFPDPAVIDFGLDLSGGGRWLEHLGGVLVDRPMPAVKTPKRQPQEWSGAQLIFHETRRGQGTWETHSPLPDPWQIEVPLADQPLRLAVRPAPSGQLGIFLEQLSQWRWLAQATKPGSRVLSLFAHSGAATLALAQAAAEVVHVDSSRQAMELARANAVASGMETAPIRWICEDAPRFVTRELRRQNTYDGFVLDPPSWGHGPKGESFAIDRDLPALLADCGCLLGPAAHGPVLLTAHSPGWSADRLGMTLSAALASTPLASQEITTGTLSCHDLAGRCLTLGGFARAGGYQQPSS